MSQEHIRSYIEVVTEMLLCEATRPTILVEDTNYLTPPQEQEVEPQLVADLNDMIFKLRSYRDPGVGDYAAGMEAGMERASDMLENLVNRLRDE
jgi:hypothetical protein